MDPSSSWCIVALPEEGHPVYKVSSEKVPHLTLLFLGESKEPAKAIRIIEAIQHTIKTSFSTKFSLGVERRGTLGDDQADVLFFYKDEAGRVRDFRSLLLKNDDIKQAYDSTFQYPEWTPHLTLGYPNNPAKPIPDDSHSISWITFDRIALWLEDSDGPEIRLDTYDPMTESVEQMHHTERMIQKGMMAMVDSDDFLEHYGVKGMKWGQRKAARNDAAVQKQAAKYKKIASKYEMKRGTREELLAEREKVQKKISKMDPDKAYRSMNALGSSNTRAEKRVGSDGKTAFQQLSAREKHNVNQQTRNKDTAIFVGKTAANSILAAAVVGGGMEAYMHVAKIPPKTKATGRAATVGLVASFVGAQAMSDLSRVSTDRKRSKLEGRRHEIDKQLSGKW